MINKVFNFIDRLYDIQKEIAVNLNKNLNGYESFWCVSYTRNCDTFEPIDNKVIEDVIKNGLIEQKKDFAGDVFDLFEEYEDEEFCTFKYELDEPLLYDVEVLVNGHKEYRCVTFFPKTKDESILIKPIYRNNDIEVGLTIEQRNHLEYYIIMCYFYNSVKRW